MRTHRFLAALAPLFLTSAACTAVLGTFEFDTGTSTGSGGKGGTGTGSSTSSGGTSNGGGGSAGGGGDAGPDAAAPPEITPSTATMGILRALQLNASTAVDWTVEETGGGSVDANGRYISPATPGTYHVKATSKADGQTASATIDVGPLGLTIRTNYGGMGNIDGPAKRAHFNNPSGIAWTSLASGGLIIADTDNSTIRRYDVTSQTVTTLAGAAGQLGTADGTGSVARFTRPMGVATSGMLAFVADTDNNCVRSVGILTGEVKTIAGACGTQQATVDGATGTDVKFAGPRQLMVNAAGTALYICERGSGTGGSIRRVDLVNNGATVTVIPSVGTCDVGPAGLQAPNKIYYTDGSSPNKLYRFTEGSAPGFAPTIEDLGTAPGSYSWGLASDEATNGSSLYAALGGKAIYAFDLGTLTFGASPMLGDPAQAGYADGDATTARFTDIKGMTFSPAAAGLYVVDSGLGAIRKVYGGGAAHVTTEIGAAAIVDRIDGPQAVARVRGPYGLSADETGKLYIADFSLDGVLSNTIRTLDTNGDVSTLAGVPNKANPAVDGPKGTARFGATLDVLYEGGNVYVADAYTVRKVTKAGDVTTIAGMLGVAGYADGAGSNARFGGTGTNLLGPTALASDRNGSLYAADAGNCAIRKIDITTTDVTTLAGGTCSPTAPFQAPLGIAFDGGKLYVADIMDHTIREVDVATGKVTTLVGISGQSGYQDGNYTKALFYRPARVLADGLGNLYVAELPLLFRGPVGTIRRVDIATRTVSTFVGTRDVLGLAPGPLSTATVNCPAGLALLPNGDLAFGDMCDYGIAVISPL